MQGNRSDAGQEEECEPCEWCGKYVACEELVVINKEPAVNWPGESVCLDCSVGQQEYYKSHRYRG